MFHKKSLHCVVTIALLLSLSVLIAGPSLFRVAQSKGAVPQNPEDFMQTLDYPDQQPVKHIYGKISVTLVANGKNTKDRTTTEVNVSATGSQSFDKTGATFQASAKGLITATTPPEPNDECKKATVQTWKWEGTSSQRQDGEEGSFTLMASKQKRLAHFEPGGIFGELNEIMVHQNISNCTTQSLGDNPLGGINYRLPLHGVPGTPFAAAANKVEADGKSLNQVLLVNPAHTGTIEGVIQTSWDGTGASGSFTVPMLARVLAGGVEWNTPAAWRAIAKEMGGPSIDTDPEMFFPGQLELTWSLNTQPGAGKP
jgi:flagellar hook assembly protein FlgD